MRQITKEERQAARWVSKALKKKSNLKKDRYGQISASRCLKTGVIPPSLFRMETTCASTACGTVGCIGGWMGLKMFEGEINPAWRFVAGAHHNSPFYDLFYNFSPAPYPITRSMAAKAIDYVLAGKKGNPWEKTFA